MSDRSTVLRHAATVLTGQLATMAFGITDTIVAGRHAEASLAALSVASAIFISVSVGLMGVLQALLPVWAEERGAQRPAMIGTLFRQALYLCGLVSGLGALVLWVPGPLLSAADIPPALHGTVRNYLAVLGFAMPLSLFFRLFSTLNQALGHPQAVARIQLLGLALKVPLSVWLTFGGAGMPELGAVGCAWATLLVNAAMLAASLWLMRTQSIYRPLRLWQRMEPPHPALLLQFAKLGVPAGLTILVEVTSFTMMALLIARQGVVPAGAHQIAANLAAVLYMVPLSLSIATSARVSFWRGAGDEARARQVAWMGFKVVALMGIALAALLFIARTPLAQLYSSQPAVATLAAALLAWVAAYHAVDGVQCFSLFILRCYRVTVAPLVVYGVMLWGVGLLGGYQLSYQGLGPWPALTTPATFWITSAGALAVTSLVFVGLLARQLRAP
ncbi:MAG: MATE family efflux transporter [Burkholderiaceae bacterium]|nr:MATE family efflux transporter [Burkholderiaceae bacterium]